MTGRHRPTGPRAALAPSVPTHGSSVTASGSRLRDSFLHTALAKLGQVWSRRCGVTGSELSGSQHPDDQEALSREGAPGEAGTDADRGHGPGPALQPGHAFEFSRYYELRTLGVRGSRCARFTQQESGKRQSRNVLESGTRPPGTGLFPADHTHDQSGRLRVETAARGSSVPRPRRSVAKCIDSRQGVSGRQACGRELGIFSRPVTRTRMERREAAGAGPGLGQSSRGRNSWAEALGGPRGAPALTGPGSAASLCPLPGPRGPFRRD